MDLPTQTDILEIKLKQKNCEHDFRFVGFSVLGSLRYRDYVCRKCNREKSTVEEE